ncbi:BLOC-1 related complex subunit 6 [Tachysurus fulvidraco]|uniref:BLOC-1 related complex subunit 6 n=1 Tax=Tachysurus fulvidraco TaxID=1234273 RepID=UPI000F4DAB37|nr:BLOC-1 related complex subunit 6 [Tachysurus fulvidraco]XP_026989844.1 BLOC-1 related complex subunit 6 [Tachysurus fulvidraco]XP_026989848.1 BLOC-1 related complex subunit 6 [Tachysurus fulvidraco]XP_026989849.1 BLOC-1 related complex subunit 6 [Tachysurus fulvidraco]XP_026989850.1 BLOC-1 related complex subunit 6 [Tachysurus fulvidraco]
MSHSSGIGYSEQEEADGTDTPYSPEPCYWTAANGSVSQLQQCGDGVACLEQDKQEGPPETHTHLAHSMDPACRQIHTNSATHLITHACGDGPSHTDKHTTHLQPVTKDSLYMETANMPHTQIEDGGGGAEEVRNQNDESEGEEIESSEESQKTADITVQPVKETTTEDSTTSQTPPTEPVNCNSSDDGHSSASTPPDHAPPLVPAPPSSSVAPAVLPAPDDWPRPAHVMAEVRVRSAPGRERVVRGMQDSKSLDGISEACGGVTRATAGEGRRATISSALELEGTVSRDGDLTHFIAKNLEQKIKMSSRPSLDTDSDCSGPVVRGRGSLRRPADIPPIDPTVLLDLHKHTQDVAHSVEMMLRSLNGTIQNMTALSVGYIQTYRDSVDSLGESVDMSIKGMYTLMARCEELDRSMQPIQTLAAQIRDIKRTLDALEAICK